jgi:hypothetical protein
VAASETRNDPNMNDPIARSFRPMLNEAELQVRPLQQLYLPRKNRAAHA